MKGALDAGPMFESAGVWLCDGNCWDIGYGSLVMGADALTAGVCWGLEVTDIPYQAKTSISNINSKGTRHCIGVWRIGSGRLSISGGRRLAAVRGGAS
ncbi:MAG: hypothetical protein KGS46_21190, partial [Chloroflexi bacterium]|nr:hypothetical protein [Chloroflexota bacterium]